MDIVDFAVIAAAVIFGNAFSFAFFMGAMKISKFEKENGNSDGAPIWVYFALMAAPLMIATGGVLIH